MTFLKTNCFDNWKINCYYMNDMLNSIQITKQEDQLITKLKKALGLPSKKAVLRRALETLVQEYEATKKAERLRDASLRVRKESLKINRDFAGLSSAAHGDLWK